MGLNVEKLHNGARINKEFLRAMTEELDSDAPEENDTASDNMVFTAVYTGWLIGKYGKDWESKM